MSVRFISAIWTDAPYDGGVLLVLLALADYCNDEGECWPRVGSIAKKARLTERQTYNILGQLKADGVLDVIPGGGRGIPSRYKLNTETLKRVSLNSASVKCDSVKLPVETLKSAAQNPEISSSAIRKNRHEPSLEPSGKICERCSNTGVREAKAHPGKERYCWCSVGARLQQLEQSEAKWKPA
jgi:hypothetical protein